MGKVRGLSVAALVATVGVGSAWLLTASLGGAALGDGGSRVGSFRPQPAGARPHEARADDVAVGARPAGATPTAGLRSVVLSSKLSRTAR